MTGSPTVDIPEGRQRRPKSIGEWNAYILRGADQNARRARLAAVPEHWRERVRSHVLCYFAVKARARSRHPAA
jgi:hypothetical protein